MRSSCRVIGVRRCANIRGSARSWVRPIRKQWSRLFELIAAGRCSDATGAVSTSVPSVGSADGRSSTGHVLVIGMVMVDEMGSASVSVGIVVILGAGRARRVDRDKLRTLLHGLHYERTAV